MLGFSPSAPIAGIRNFVGVTATLAGATSLTFTSTAAVGVYTYISGETSLSFSVSAPMSTIQGMVGATSLTFDVLGKVTVAGKPIIVTALPDSFTIRAQMDDHSTTALPDSYITRGWQ